MNTTAQSKIKIEQLKSIALKQHLGEDYFVLNGKVYEGTENEANEQYLEQDADINGYLPTDERFEPNFQQWCEDNITEIDEYNEDDYNNDYLILTDSEADEKCKQCILDSVSNSIKSDFHKEKNFKYLTP